MKSFSEIYNRYRTYTKYTPDINGELVKINRNGCTYFTEITKVDPENDIILGEDNVYHYHKDAPIKHFRSEIVKDTRIIGTALTFAISLWEVVLFCPSLWKWIIGIVTDGYWMIFFSPVALLYWILVTAFYIPMMIILTLLVIIALIYTPIFEIPATIVNKEKLFLNN